MALTVSTLDSLIMTGSVDPSGSHDSTSEQSVTGGRFQLLIVSSHSDATNPPPVHQASNTYGFDWDELFTLTFAARQSNGDTLTHYTRGTVFYGAAPATDLGHTTVDFGTIGFADENNDRFGGWSHKEISGFTTTIEDNGLSVIRQGPTFDSGSAPNDSNGSTPLATISLPAPVLNANSQTWIGGVYDDLVTAPSFGRTYTPITNSSTRQNFVGTNAALNQQSASEILSTNVGPLGGPYQAWTAAVWEICDTPTIPEFAAYWGTLVELV